MLLPSAFSLAFIQQIIPSVGIVYCNFCRMQDCIFIVWEKENLLPLANFVCLPLAVGMMAQLFLPITELVALSPEGDLLCDNGKSASVEMSRICCQKGSGFFNQFILIRFILSRRRGNPCTTK